MYNNLDQVWAGFAKSAGEGIATPIGLPIWTLLIFGGHVLPWMLLPVSVFLGDAVLFAVSAVGVAANLTMRLLLHGKFKQSLIGVVLHPIGALMVLAINWLALLRHLAGRPNVWRGRGYLRSSQ